MTTLPGTLTYLDQSLFLIEKHIDNRGYDFDFSLYFPCTHPIYLPESIEAIARFGAIDDYPARFNSLRELGVRLINSPDEHRRIDELSEWYPRIEALTPPSLWFEGEPDLDTVERRLGWPVFVKGASQTKGHLKRHCIAHDRGELERLLTAHHQDPMLSWQKPMFRKYVQLRPLDTSVHSLHPDRIQGSYEFRAFVYKGEIVGLGPYWWQDESYRLSQTDERTVKSLVHSAASMLAAPFVVIDVAQTIAGQWIVIESNDAQESGHAGISPLELWSNIVAREQAIVALGACSHAVSLAQYENKTPLVISRPSPRALARGIMGRR